MLRLGEAEARATAAHDEAKDDLEAAGVGV